jgi:23S rRNA (uracil1939-C5)-methyltransferase
MPVTEHATIIRIAAKGDGLTGDGRHIAFSAPGDTLLPDGGLLHGPHHVTPPCRHFQSCGGCRLQQLDAASLNEFVRDRVVMALAGQSIAADIVHPPQISPPHSRRRASMRATRLGKQWKLGFSGSGSHRIIDLKQCEILRPEMFAIVAPLRECLSTFNRQRHDVTIEMTCLDQGVDLVIGALAVESLAERERLIDFARDNALARLSIDTGYGVEVQWEPEPVTITLGGVAVGFPHGSFLQATVQGEAALIRAMQSCIGDADMVADLFSGLGTFALAAHSQKRKIYAAEASRDAIMVLKSAANSRGLTVFTEHRDLFRRPLQIDELNRFAAVILDPPRAGAREQVQQLAQSVVPTVCYISCNPASFARDAKSLVEAGYRLSEIWPVGQFLWSTHVELAARFIRPRSE